MLKQLKDTSEQVLDIFCKSVDISSEDWKNLMKIKSTNILQLQKYKLLIAYMYENLSSAINSSTHFKFVRDEEDSRIETSI